LVPSPDMQLRPNLELLRRASVFGGLEERELNALIICLRVRVCDAGTWLFREGDPGASMLVVAEGALAATVRDHKGTEREINRMGPGEVVGEMAFLDPAPRSASIRALTAATYYELDEDGMETLRVNSPSAAAALSWAVIRDVTRRLRRMDQLIEAELAPRPDGRSS
jgi:CRP/FNR family transcriptional regulator, cyclic AMP receptor protein